MEKQLMSNQKTIITRLLLLLTLGFTGLILSCNNEKKEQTKEQNMDAKVAAPAPLTTTLDEFPVLYIAFQDITTAFNSGAPGQQVRRIDFQFHFDSGGVNGRPTLIGYTARQNGTYIPQTSVITLIKAAANPVSLAYPLNLGTIEFTRAEYDALATSVTHPPQQYLVFIPVKSANPNHLNSVTYKTAWSNIVPTDIKILVIGDELKPSPPATPVP